MPTLAEIAPRLLEHTTRRRDEATSLLATLVNLDTCSHAHEALERACAWIEAQVRSLGFDEVVRHEARDYGPVLAAVRRGRGRARVLLLAHYDTVFDPGEPQRRPFRVEGDRACGPGVADMKAGIVTLWEALRALDALGWNDAAALTVIHNGDEEIGSHAARPHIEAAAAAADFCLVLEPGRPNGAVVTARKGVARFTLTVHGKAAHAGTAPQDGASAVVALARKIVAVHGLNDYARGLTLNAIVSQGGTRSNVVPDLAVAEIDVRLPTLAMRDEVLAALEAIAAADDLPGTRATLAGGVERPPFEAGAGGLALLEIAREANAALGLPPLQATSTGGGSDGNFVAAMGVPVLDGLGAAGGAYHSADEYVLLDTLPQRAALVAAVLWEACRRDRLVPG